MATIWQKVSVTYTVGMSVGATLKIRKRQTVIFATPKAAFASFSDFHDGGADCRLLARIAKLFIWNGELLISLTSLSLAELC